MVRKFLICKKVYSDQFLDFPILLLLFLHTFCAIFHSLDAFSFNIIRVSDSLDPDQARQNVGPDLDPNCLQRLSADKKVLLAGKELNTEQLLDTTFPG